jgi:HEPN domain-containing protein
MDKQTEHWVQQATYDFETATVLRSSKRNVYAVYMCHLALEKMLKGLFQKVVGAVPPKTHNLVVLVSKTGITPPEGIGRFLLQLNDASVATRYPEDLSQMLATYTDELTDTIIRKTDEAVTWTRNLLSKQ